MYIPGGAVIPPKNPEGVLATPGIAYAIGVLGIAYAIGVLRAEKN